MMDYSHWLNRGKIERHLDWYDRSEEKTPFISVFDNQGKLLLSILVGFWKGQLILIKKAAHAVARAKLLKERGHTGVFIAEITLPHPNPGTLMVTFSDERVEVPVLQHTHGAGNMTFISVRNLGARLHVDFRIIQASEWLAVEFIPVNAISRLVAS